MKPKPAGSRSHCEDGSNGRNPLLGLLEASTGPVLPWKELLWLRQKVFWFTVSLYRSHQTSTSCDACCNLKSYFPKEGNTLDPFTRWAHLMLSLACFWIYMGQTDYKLLFVCYWDTHSPRHRLQVRVEWHDTHLSWICLLVGSKTVLACWRILNKISERTTIAKNTEQSEALNSRIFQTMFPSF